MARRVRLHVHVQLGPYGTDTNTATVEWRDQTLSDASQLDAGSVEPAATSIGPRTADPIDKCVDVTDTFDARGSVPRPGHRLRGRHPAGVRVRRTFDVVLGCVKYDNSATFTGQDDENEPDAADATATVCGHIPPTVEKTATGSFTGRTSGRSRRPSTRRRYEGDPRKGDVRLPDHRRPERHRRQLEGQRKDQGLERQPRQRDWSGRRRPVRRRCRLHGHGWRR